MLAAAVRSLPGGVGGVQLVGGEGQLIREGGQLIRGGGFNSPEIRGPRSQVDPLGDRNNPEP